MAKSVQGAKAAKVRVALKFPPSQAPHAVAKVPLPSGVPEDGSPVPHENVDTAISWRNIDLLGKVLASEGPGVRCSGDGLPLVKAAAAGWAEGVRLLLDAGADVRETTKSGFEALHYAAGARRGETDACIRMLVAAGADLAATGVSARPASSVMTHDRLDPLGWAIERGSVSGVRTLLELGADPSTRACVSGLEAWAAAFETHHRLDMAADICAALLARGAPQGVWFARAQLAMAKEGSEWVAGLTAALERAEVLGGTAPAARSSAPKGP